MANPRKTAGRNKRAVMGRSAREDAKKGLPPTTTNGTVVDVLTLSEAAGYLRLQEQDVLALIQEQGLPARKIGAQWRLLKDAIQEWLRTVASTPQVRKESQLALAGKYKDDPDLLWICEEAYRQRGRPVAEDE
jgi:excisionase family DNA binding protein